MPVDDRQYIDHLPNHGLDHFPFVGRDACDRPPQCCGLVGSVMKDQAIFRKRSDEFSEPEERLVLLPLVIRPERMVDGRLSSFDQRPDEVVEVSVDSGLGAAQLQT